MTFLLTPYGIQDFVRTPRRCGYFAKLPSFRSSLLAEAVFPAGAAHVQQGVGGVTATREGATPPPWANFDVCPFSTLPENKANRSEIDWNLRRM